MTKETILININPEDQSYEMEVNFCKLEHIYAVCKDIITRIENDEFAQPSDDHPDLKIYDTDDILH